MTSASAGGPSDDAVRVLLLSLDRPAGRSAEVEGILSCEERERARRFRFDQHRRRFEACRGLLRIELAKELKLHPKDVAFTYGPFGKPALAHDTNVRFNVSHSGDYALLAIGSGGEIGVDLEQMRPLADLDQMAGCVCSPTERGALSALPAAERLEGFYGMWTRKEAYIKARGDGLSRRLEDFDVTLGPDAPARLLRVAGEPREPERWRLSALSPVPGYAAAVCIERRTRALFCNW